MIRHGSPISRKRTKLIAAASVVTIAAVVVIAIAHGSVKSAARVIPATTASPATPASPATKASSATSPSAKGAHGYRSPPRSGDSWYWEIDPPAAGLAGLPATSAAYPAPGSATMWDTDLFEDSNTTASSTLGIPTGPSTVVHAIHAAGHYSVCYVEVGAYQSGFPDDSDFASADYGAGAKRYQLQGYPNEWWLDISGFRNYVAGDTTTLSGAAVNIAAVLSNRFRWCALEGQDGVEADDLDGYTNNSASGAKGGGWDLVQADSAGFERWIAHQAHADGLAILQKNDQANAVVDEPLFDGVVTEECNHYQDPCAGPGGDWDAYLAAGKPVLDAEYSQDGEAAEDFCPADRTAGIWGALYSVALDGDQTYQVCWNSKNQL